MIGVADRLCPELASYGNEIESDSKRNGGGKRVVWGQGPPGLMFIFAWALKEMTMVTVATAFLEKLCGYETTLENNFLTSSISRLSSLLLGWPCSDTVKLWN